MTKREFYSFVESVLATVDVEGKDEALEVLNKERHALDAKNEAAKKRAAEKRAAGDAMKSFIYESLGDEPMTVADIVSAIEGEYPDVTPAKVVSRMKTLVADNVVSKDTVKVNGRKLVAYLKA